MCYTKGMDERDFVTKKRETWEQLAGIVGKAGGRGGARALNREELLALGPLYRRVCSDLAYARAHAVSEDLVTHLNGLAGQAHALLYEAETSGQAARSALNFYMYDFPALLQRHVRYFLAAFGITLVRRVLCLLVRDRPSRSIRSVHSAAVQAVGGNMERGRSRTGVQHGVFRAVVHQQSARGPDRVCHRRCGGRTDVLLYCSINGATLGALSAEITQVHQHAKFWPGILPHGIAELTAIFICGGAGLLLGGSLLLPGRYRRAEAFRKAGLESIYLVLGSIPLFVFAGIVEGMFSHLGLPGWLRLTFAGVNGILWYLLLVCAAPPTGRRYRLARTAELRFRVTRTMQEQERPVFWCSDTGTRILRRVSFFLNTWIPHPKP